MDISTLVTQYEPRSLIEPFITDPRPQTFLKDFMLTGTPKFEDTSFIEFDKMDFGRTAAPFVSRFGDGNEIKDSTFDTQLHVAPYIWDKIVFTSENFTQRQIGKTVYDAKPSDPTSAKIAMWYAQMEDRFIRKEELMVSEILTTGKVVVAGEGASYTVDYKPSANLFKTLTGGDLWGSGTEDKYKLIKDQCQAVRNAGGRTPTHLIGGVSAIEKLLDDETIIAKLDNRNVNIGAFDFTQMYGGTVTDCGVLRGPGFQIRILSYQDTYDLSGTATNYLDPKRIVLTSPGIDFKMHYGMLYNLNKGDVRGARYPMMYIKQNGKKGIASLESAPLPVLKEINAISSIKVLA